ncbi:hypothetical protein THRCLA_21595 [Thraustotheca clavata]|uniref:Uncharacterized protein n=1 Tax=Thraustotheca clavata TaxID=74557 RepID=A0A1V9ZUZ7_9STRA|nr:hypothetical protein THRCLA_21595 [Thraustotheca clavata]
MVTVCLFYNNKKEFLKRIKKALLKSQEVILIFLLSMGTSQKEKNQAADYLSKLAPNERRTVSYDVKQTALMKTSWIDSKTF